MSEAKAVVTMDPAVTTAPAAATAPAPEKVTLDGKEFTVDAAVAAALKAAQQSAEQAGVAAKDIETRLRAEVEEAKRAAAQPAKPAAASTGDDDLDTLLFTNPKEALARVVKQAVAEATNLIAGQNAVVDAQKAFWTNFYDQNPELKDDDLVVRAIMQRDMVDLRPLRIPEATKKLAEAAQKYLLERGVKREKPKKTDKTEGGNESTGKRTNPSNVSEDLPQGGLSAVLKERAAARRSGAREGSKAT